MGFPAVGVVGFQPVIDLAARYHAGAVPDVKSGALGGGGVAAQVDQGADVDAIGDDGGQKGIGHQRLDGRYGTVQRL